MKSKAKKTLIGIGTVAVLGGATAGVVATSGNDDSQEYASKSSSSKSSKSEKSESSLPAVEKSENMASVPADVKSGERANQVVAGNQVPQSNGGGVGSATSGFADPSYVYNQLLSQGWSAGSAGLMTNTIIPNESGYQIDIWNMSGSGAYGAFQLLGHGEYGGMPLDEQIAVATQISNAGNNLSPWGY